MKTKYDYVNNTYIDAPSEVETTKDIIKSIEKKDQIIEKQNKTIDKLTKMLGIKEMKNPKLGIIINDSEQDIILMALSMLAERYKKSAEFYESLEDGEPRITDGTDWRKEHNKVRSICKRIRVAETSEDYKFSFGRELNK